MKKLLLGIMTVLLTLTLSGCKDKKGEVPEIVETPISTMEDMTIEGIQISDFSLVYENGMTNVYAKVTNKMEDAAYLKRIDFTLKDEEGNEIGKFYFYVDQILEVNEEKVLQSGISSDVTEAVTVEYAIVRE